MNIQLEKALEDMKAKLLGQYIESLENFELGEDAAGYEHIGRGQWMQFCKRVRFRNLG